MVSLARATFPVTRGRSIELSEDECQAVIELGLRPTYSIIPTEDPEGDVALMLDNALQWMKAADVTNAGKSGRLPEELWQEVAEMLEEATQETLRDLGNTILGRRLWHDGSTAHGFPHIGGEETEALYDEYIDRERHLLEAFHGIAAKLTLNMTRPAA